VSFLRLRGCRRGRVTPARRQHVPIEPPRRSDDRPVASAVPSRFHTDSFRRLCPRRGGGHLLRRRRFTSIAHGSGRSGRLGHRLEDGLADGSMEPSLLTVALHAGSPRLGCLKLQRTVPGAGRLIVVSRHLSFPGVWARTVAASASWRPVGPAPVLDDSHGLDWRGCPFPGAGPSLVVFGKAPAWSHASHAHFGSLSETQQPP